PPATGRPATLARNGMVATPHALATSAGLGVLERGGGAVDALIAANAVLCVAYPHMAGLGGDCFALVWDSHSQTAHALNGSGRSGAGATADFYLTRGLSAIPARGPMAANTVPGAVDAWWELHQRFGRQPWGDLFSRAVDYAERGVPVSTSLAAWIATDLQVLTEHAAAGDIYLRNGHPYRLGDVLVQTNLARTLKEIAAGGRDAFYRGAIAREMVDSLPEGGALLTREDFADHRAEWTPPLAGSYRGRKVITTPPNSQGLALLLLLNMLEGDDLTALGDGSADYVHTIVEATKLAFADSERWVSDPEFGAVLPEHLLSKEYAAARRRLIDPQHAAPPEYVRSG
ncbi:MAG: gamma-glutamyltransferase, partial [Chloroflexi bacterium]|nr:gamma-glutamyltransferase [Chloroflexota bacterium]